MELCGIVASKLADKFSKPTILICIEGDMGTGSGRSLPGFDLHDALSKLSEYLIKYGGHEMAVGLTLDKNMFNKFKESMEKIAKEQNVKDIVSVIKIDSQILPKDINIELMNEIIKLEPFGEKNREPVFICKNLKIDSIRTLSEGKHLKLILKDDNYLVSAIGFNIGNLSEEYLIGDKIDVLRNIRAE